RPRRRAYCGPAWRHWQQAESWSGALLIGGDGLDLERLTLQRLELPLDALLFRESRVQTSGAPQLLVGAALHDAPLLQHQDLVAVRGGRHPVRDENQRTRATLAIDGIQDAALGASIDGAERVVQHQDLRLRQEGRRQGDA